MYTTTYIPHGNAVLFPNMTTHHDDEIPLDLLATLMDKASEQTASGDFVSQGEMEKLVAAW